MKMWNASFRWTLSSIMTPKTWIILWLNPNAIFSCRSRFLSSSGKNWIPIFSSAIPRSRMLWKFFPSRLTVPERASSATKEAGAPRLARQSRICWAYTQPGVEYRVISKQVVKFFDLNLCILPVSMVFEKKSRLVSEAKSDLRKPTKSGAVAVSLGQKKIARFTDVTARTRWSKRVSLEVVF